MNDAALDATANASIKQEFTLEIRSGCEQVPGFLYAPRIQNFDNQLNAYLDQVYAIAYADA
jgi:small nuclear ribonucleoprotein (snRNP)-like protein